jgi:hypothetical protein
MAKAGQYRGYFYHGGKEGIHRGKGERKVSLSCHSVKNLSVLCGNT